jgi:hypothetical protein
MFIILLNLAEKQQSDILELKETNQQLRDEINRLKGEQGKPQFSTSKKNEDISSSHPRNKKRAKDKKQGKKRIFLLTKK